MDLFCIEVTPTPGSVNTFSKQTWIDVRLDLSWIILV